MTDSVPENNPLFDDLPQDTKDPVTLESLQKENEALMQQLALASETISDTQSNNMMLIKQLRVQKEDSANAIARMQKQSKENESFAIEKFVKEILPVIDGLERGLAAISPEQRANDAKFDKLAQGVEKTIGQLSAVFNQFGIREINPAGKDYDAAKHEVVGTDDTAEADSETVIKVAQKGYELNGRIIRIAKVIVKP